MIPLPIAITIIVVATIVAAGLGAYWTQGFTPTSLSEVQEKIDRLEKAISRYERDCREDA